MTSSSFIKQKKMEKKYGVREEKAMKSFTAQHGAEFLLFDISINASSHHYSYAATFFN